MILNQTLPISYHFYIKFRLSTLINLSAVNKQRNRCVISGRVWNVLKKTQYSRFVFREKANFGYLPGVSRLSR